MIDIALIGAAHPHAGYLLQEVAASSDLRIVAAAEPDESARESLRAKAIEALGEELAVSEDLDATLTQTDAGVAVMCGVYAERADLVVAALDRGMAVLADKPLCTDLDQLERIEAALARASGPLSVMFDKRFYPETVALMDLVAGGDLGELAMVASTGPHKLLMKTRPDWFFRRDSYGGIATDLPVHDIDILLRLTGATTGQVSALTGNYALPEEPGFEDHVAVLLRAGRTSATIDANWLQPAASDVHGHYRMRVVGTSGTAEVDWAYCGVTVTTHDTPRHDVALPPRPRPVQFFFDALREGRRPDVTADEALLATRVALLAQQSADDGGQPIWF